MKHRYSRIFQSLWLYIPVFFLVNSLTFQYYEDELMRDQDQLHRLAWSSDDDEYISQRFQITLTGIPESLPTDDDYTYFEHKLFAYLNRQLTSRDLQISRVHVDQEQTELKYNGFSGVKSFTILVGSRREEEDEESEEVENRDDLESETEPDMGGNIIHEVLEGTDENGEGEKTDRELNNPGSSANKLLIQVDVEGRDLSGLKGHFKKHVEGAIKAGHKAIINELVRSANAREYFQGTSWIGVKSIGASKNASPYGRSSETGSPQDMDEDRRDDSPPPLPSQDQEEGKDDQPEKVKKPKTHRARPMNAKAIEFRIISGSIFLSLCLTAILSNTIRILARKREERRKRMEKARQAYEAPKKAITSKGGSEKKFTGLLDDGDQYR